MIQGLFDSGAVPVLEQVVNFAQARHNVLASNIANLSTPGYRTRDLSTTAFQAQLREAIDARRQGKQTHASGSGRAQYGDPLSNVSRNLEGILYHDDSNLGLEQQVAEISKNHLLHNTALTIMTSQFRLLQAAIAERA